MMQIKQVFDYNTRTMTEHVPTFSKCNRYTIPDEINVGDVLKKVFSPQSGITTFTGEQKLKWENSAEYSFKVGKATLESTEQTLLFSEQSMNLDWVQFLDSPYILNLPKGIVNRTFTDDEFVIPECTQFVNKPYQRNDGSAHRIKLFF